MTPKVKPLNWREETGDFEARTPFGEYEVSLDDHEDVADCPYHVWAITHFMGYYRTEDAAKEAAQSDYESRILEALEQP